MNAQPEMLRLVRQWVELAEEDLKNAEYTLTLWDDCPLRTVCFHAQQCAEKYLKALLTLHSVEFPKTHDLIDLLNLVPDGCSLDATAEDLVLLNRYAVEIRYPGAWEEVTRDEAEAAATTAREIRAKVRSILPPSVLSGPA